MKIDRRVGRWTGVALMATAFAHSAAAQGLVERVSVSSAGVEANGDSFGGDITGVGDSVVFWSNATNLVPGDTNGVSDVFVRNRVTGTTACLSRVPGGAFGNGVSLTPRISADGRLVVFASNASNLAPGDGESPTSASSTDIFLLDRIAQTMTRISRLTSGAEAAGQFGNPAISSDGSVVAFESSLDLATGLGVSREVWLYSVATGALERVDMGPPTGFARYPALSADGRFVAYRQLVGVFPAMPVRQIFVRDRVLGTTELVSEFANGLPGNFDSDRPTISADGRFVAFDSLATNDVAASASTPVLRTYLRDRASATTQLTSMNSTGGLNTVGANTSVVSPDGRRVAFYSNGAGFVPGDASADGDAVVFDRTNDIAIPVSVSAAGAFAIGSTAVTAFRGDGLSVVLTSSANNLVPGDTNGAADVLVKDLAPLFPATYCTALVNSAGCTPQISGIGIASATSPATFTLTAQQLVNNQPTVLFYGFAPNASPFVGGTLCVASPLRRTPMQLSGGSPAGVDCSGSVSLNFNALIQSGLVPQLVAGTTVYAQATYSDPGAALGRGHTQALAFSILP